MIAGDHLVFEQALATSAAVLRALLLPAFTFALGAALVFLGSRILFRLLRQAVGGIIATHPACCGLCAEAAAYTGVARAGWYVGGWEHDCPNRPADDDPEWLHDTPPDGPWHINPATGLEERCWCACHDVEVCGCYH